MLKYTIIFNWGTKSNNYSFQLYLNIFCLNKALFQTALEIFILKLLLCKSMQGAPKVV